MTRGDDFARSSIVQGIIMKPGEEPRYASNINRRLNPKEILIQDSEGKSHIILRNNLL